MRGFLLIIFSFFWSVYSGAVPAFCTTPCPAKIDAIAPVTLFGNDLTPKRLFFVSTSADQAFTWDSNGIGTCITPGTYHVFVSYTLPATRNGVELCMTLFHNTLQYTSCDSFYANAHRNPTMLLTTTQQANYLLDFVLGDTLRVDFISSSYFANYTGRIFAR